MVELEYVSPSIYGNDISVIDKYVRNTYTGFKVILT